MTTNTINDSQTIAGGGGTVLAGRYRIVRQLGRGGMGSVWLAEDTQLDNKPFAIKMLPSILVSNKRAYRQLKDEALVAMRLVHPNIVQIRAFEENNGNPFLVMDYIDGQSLDDYLAEKGKLSEEETIRVLRPIAAALDYAHGEGVVHRDVKPANVMIRKDGHPFVLDFGIAREIQETLTRVTGKLSSGTLLYMSPEQLNGEQPRPAQDIYSFAAMAYECLKGEPPFVRGAIEDQIKNKLPEPLVGASVPLARAIMAGLAKKPEERPLTCAAVLGSGDFSRAERVERAEAGEQPSPAAVGGTEDVSRKERKERKAGVRKALAVLVLLSVFGAGGWWYYVQQQETVRCKQALNVVGPKAEVGQNAKAEGGQPLRMQDAAYTNRLVQLQERRMALVNEMAVLREKIGKLGAETKSDESSEYINLTNRLAQCESEIQMIRKETLATVRMRIKESKD